MTEHPGRPPASSWSYGAGYPPPYPYPPYPGYPPAPVRPRNGLGVASLLLAIAGLVTALSVLGGVGLGIAAVLLGSLGHARVKRGEADNGGIAIAGVVLGVLAIVAGIACVFVYLGVWKTVGGDDYIGCMTKAGSDPVLQQQCTDRFREHLEHDFGNTPAPAAPQVQQPDSDVMPA